MTRLFHTLVRFSVLLSLTAMLAGAAAPGLDQTGKPDLKSVGPLAFGPEGVLFVGDPQGAAIFAIGIEPASKSSAPVAEYKLEGIGAKLAALLGTKAEDLLINDLAVQPGTGIAYLSISRGRGPDAEPVIATVTPAGKITILPLDAVPFAKVALANAPGPEAKDRGRSLRGESITDLNYIDGRVFIAGLSNEEFASKLRAISFPFAAADQGTSIEIYHGAHGKYETNAPVRTFASFNINGEPHLLAAYTCTPLVTIPLSQLKGGEKVRGTTVAELGNRNRPIDMVVYEKNGHAYLLMANSARGVMKVTTDNIAKQSGITEKIDNTAGLTYETIEGLKGVEQLDKLGDHYALLLVRGNGDTLTLTSIALP